MYGDIEYIADTLLLERTFANLVENEGLPNKYAFDLGSIIGNIGSSIKQFVGGQIHGKDTGGVVRTVTNLMAPALFFRLHPILGLIATAAISTGFAVVKSGPSVSRSITITFL